LARRGVRGLVDARPRALSGPAGYLFTAPALAILVVFTILPTIYTRYISLFEWNSLNISRSRFLGLSNYRELFGANDFPVGALDSLYLAVAMVIGGTAFSLLIALLLQRGGRRPWLNPVPAGSRRCWSTSTAPSIAATGRCGPTPRASRPASAPPTAPASCPLWTTTLLPG